jgi:spore germination cell wall hydrolase CwlJ-like protein
MLKSLKGLVIALAILPTAVLLPKITHQVAPDYTSIKTYGIVEDHVVQIPDLPALPKASRPFLILTNENFHTSDRALTCLAKNIYYEARGEGEYGMYAVAQVTINRLKTGYWGNTVCKVVYARSQFSWTLDKELKKPHGESWAESLRIAHSVLNGEQVESLMTALFYHATYVNPRWRDRDAKIKQVGAHIFYAKALGSSLEIKVDNI